MARVILVLSTRQAWWVEPALQLGSFAIWLGFPIDPEQVARFICEHGIKVIAEDAPG